ncbi:hypothetical protein [Glycomyces sp. NPDC048151]|uniref:hypothetical protein n=1 Tax=Glycomyces sp. NPDC048151 TaxID=3364002 RepID=UPI0037129671
MAKPSDSSRHQADLGVITRALPFETIPDEPLRAHFARWLLDFLVTADRLGPFPSVEPETPPQAIPLKSGTTQSARAAPASKPIRTAAVPLLESAPLGDPPADEQPENEPPEAEPLKSDLLESGPPGCEALEPDLLPLLEWQGPPAPPRPQFVRQGDDTVWVTKPILRSRGWTDAAVRKFLPQPEGLKPNPRFSATGAPMQVWRPATIATAEATPDWRNWLEGSLRRRGTTLDKLAQTDDPDFRTRLETARAAIESEGGR